MIVSIHQPAYLPWLGYCERIARSDVHVVLNHVQFEKNSFVNRNRVRVADGACWLTVPVCTAGRFGHLAIRDVEIDNAGDWRRRHWRTLVQSYGKTPYFSEYAAFLEGVYTQVWTKLAPLCEMLTEHLLAALGIRTQRVSSAELGVGGRKDDLVLNICRQLGATTYLSGALGRNYLNPARFADYGIEIVYQDYAHPRYPQGRQDFVPNLSVLDLLCHCGPASRDVILNAAEVRA